MSVRTLHVPGDKSVSHRALMFAALAEGESTLCGLLTAADVQSTAAALRALGCRVPELHADTPVSVRGVGLRGLRSPAAVIDCGNSGTTARLLLGILAGSRIDAELTGDESLRARPMARVTDPLTRMGARFEFLAEPGRLPLRVHGGELESIQFDSPHASAQVKSALLLAGLVGGVRVTVTEPRVSRDHTERMLAAQGVNVRRFDSSDGAGVVLEPAASLQPLDVHVPGDFSSAAFLLGLGLLREPGTHVASVGLNPTRTGMLSVLERMGARVEASNVREEGGEPLGDLAVQPVHLRATNIEAAEVPALIDEIPILGVLAARAEGTTRIRGASELRVKETDRIHALVQNLQVLGVAVQEHEDGMDITGTRAPLRGTIRTFGDHRIAMAFGVLGRLPGNDIAIDDPGCVQVSFPGFWDVTAA